MEYERGDYGTPDTTKVWRVPITLHYRTGHYSFEASVPFIHAESTGTIIVTSRGRGRRATTTASTTSQSESGLGDVELAATYSFMAALEIGLASSITGRVKLGTADETKNLGTGENDYALEAGVSKNFYYLNVFGSIGYEISGDPPNENLDNVWYGSVGMSKKLSVLQKIGAQLYVGQATASDTDDAVEATVFYNHAFSKGQTLTAYVLKGLSDGSPDWGGGVGIQVGF